MAREWLEDDGNGVTRRVELAEVGRVGEGVFTETLSQDVQGLLDHNQALRTLNDGYSPSREMRRTATIPAIIIAKWKNELGVDVFNPDHADAVKRLLNDPDWAYLRTAGGRL